MSFHLNTKTEFKLSVIFEQDWLWLTAADIIDNNLPMRIIKQHSTSEKPDEHSSRTLKNGTMVTDNKEQNSHFILVSGSKSNAIGAICRRFALEFCLRQICREPAANLRQIVDSAAVILPLALPLAVKPC